VQPDRKHRAATSSTRRSPATRKTGTSTGSPRATSSTSSSSTNATAAAPPRIRPGARFST